jgi:hypothetical protein
MILVVWIQLSTTRNVPSGQMTQSMRGSSAAAGLAERLNLGQVEPSVLVRHQELVELAQHGDDQALRGRR